jgi:cyanate permease
MIFGEVWQLIQLILQLLKDLMIHHVRDRSLVTLTLTALIMLTIFNVNYFKVTLNLMHLFILAEECLGIMRIDAL